MFGKEAPSVTVDSKDFLPPAPKGSGHEELMGRRVLLSTHQPAFKSQPC